VAPRFQGLSDTELERATARLDPAADDEPSLVRLRDASSALHDESSAPASSPFPLLRRLA
jgi:hypothetical protein